MRGIIKNSGYTVKVEITGFVDGYMWTEKEKRS